MKVKQLQIKVKLTVGCKGDGREWKEGLEWFKKRKEKSELGFELGISWARADDVTTEPETGTH